MPQDPLGGHSPREGFPKTPSVNQMPGASTDSLPCDQLTFLQCPPHPSSPEPRGSHTSSSHHPGPRASHPSSKRPAPAQARGKTECSPLPCPCGPALASPPHPKPSHQVPSGQLPGVSPKVPLLSPLRHWCSPRPQLSLTLLSSHTIPLPCTTSKPQDFQIPTALLHPYPRTDPEPSMQKPPYTFLNFRSGSLPSCPLPAGLGEIDGPVRSLQKQRRMA